MKPHSVYKRTAVSCVTITVGILAATASLDRAIRRSVVNRRDEACVRYLDKAGVRALTTFAVFRLIEAPGGRKSSP